MHFGGITKTKRKNSKQTLQLNIDRQRNADNCRYYIAVNSLTYYALQITVRVWCHSVVWNFYVVNNA